MIDVLQIDKISQINKWKIPIKIFCRHHLLIDRLKTQQYLDGFQYNREPLVQDHKLAHLVHMKCEEVVLKQSNLETSTHQEKLLW